VHFHSSVVNFLMYGVRSITASNRVATAMLSVVTAAALVTTFGTRICSVTSVMCGCIAGITLCWFTVTPMFSP